MVVAAGSAAAVAATVHTAYNLTRLRRPPDPAPDVAERVSVLVPARDEADRIGACLGAILDSRGVPDFEVVVLDDGSTDGTSQVVAGIAGSHPRVLLVTGSPVPPGWHGKPWACSQLADRAGGSVFVFLDADVVLGESGLAATVALLRGAGVDLVSPYPAQECGSWVERIVQPLLQWSWLTTVPLAIAERSGRPALAVANGQLLAVDAGAYARSGGHAAVRDRVLDDIALARAVVRAGGSAAVADGTGIAQCRMYAGGRALREGYAKSLWCAFGSSAAGLGAAAALAVVYVLPAVAAVRGSRIGAVGYAAGVAGRVLVARRVGGTAWPDAVAHPVSIAAFGYLMWYSVVRHRQGRLEWKGRPIR
jgi:Glycosyltransferase like family 2